MNWLRGLLQVPLRDDVGAGDGDRDSGARAPQQREGSPWLVVIERGSQPELVLIVHRVERAGR